MKEPFFFFFKYKVGRYSIVSRYSPRKGEVNDKCMFHSEFVMAKNAEELL